MTDMPPALRHRLRQVRPLLALEFVGVPLLYLGLTIAAELTPDPLEQSALSSGPTFDVMGLLPAVLVGVAALLIWRKVRHTPSSWATAGIGIGAVVLVVSIGFSSGLGALVGSVGLPAIGLGTVALCAGLGWAARKLLVGTLPVEFADSPYEWSFRVRGATNVQLVIGTEQVSVRERRSSGASSSRTTTASYPLHTVTFVGDTAIDGTTVVPQLPKQIQTEVPVLPGQAVVVEVRDQRLVIPVDNAEEVRPLLHRRVLTAVQGQADRARET